MGATGTGNGLSARYIYGDKERRRDFDRRLAGYLRSHRERWDVTAIVEPLQLLGKNAGKVDVHLTRRATGKLSVTLEFELAPAGAAQQPGRPGPRPATGGCRVTGPERLTHAATRRKSEPSRIKERLASEAGQAGAGSANGGPAAPPAGEGA